MKKMTSDVVFTTVSQVVAIVAVIGIQIVLARSTDLATFGQVALAQAIVAVFEGAFVARGAEAAIQLLGQNWSRRGASISRLAADLMAHDWVISLCGYMIFALGAFAVAPLLGVNGPFVALLGLTVVLQIGYGLRRSLFLLNGQVRQQAVFETIQSVASVVITVPLILLFSEWGLLAGALISASVKTLSVRIQTETLWRQAREGDDDGQANNAGKAIRHSSLHSILRNLLTNGAANADVLILGLLGRPEIVAGYRVAKTLAGLPTRIAGPVWVVLRPSLLTALTTDDHRRYCGLVLRAAVGFTVVSALALLAAIPLAGPVLSHFYGPQYDAAATPLLILMAGTAVFGAITGWLSFTMIITSRKALGTSIFAAQLILVAVGGWLFSGGSAVAMASVVAGVNVVISAVAWWALFAGRFRHQTPA